MSYSLPGSSVHGNLGKSTGVGCHFLLQGILSTQKLNLGLLHCRQILYRLSYDGCPDYWYIWSYFCHLTLFFLFPEFPYGLSFFFLNLSKKVFIYVWPLICWLIIRILHSKMIGFGVYPRGTQGVKRDPANISSSGPCSSTPMPFIPGCPTLSQRYTWVTFLVNLMPLQSQTLHVDAHSS